jgi:hypothetical protein
MGAPVVYWELFSLFPDPDGRVLGIWEQGAS